MADTTPPAWPVVDALDCIDDRLHDLIGAAADVAPRAPDALS